MWDSIHEIARRSRGAAPRLRAGTPDQEKSAISCQASRNRHCGSCSDCCWSAAFDSPRSLLLSCPRTMIRGLTRPSTPRRLGDESRWHRIAARMSQTICDLAALLRSFSCAETRGWPGQARPGLLFCRRGLRCRITVAGLRCRITVTVYLTPNPYLEGILALVASAARHRGVERRPSFVSVDGSPRANGRDLSRARRTPSRPRRAGAPSGVRNRKRRLRCALVRHCARR
jgi:hypothetical protein